MEIKTLFAVLVISLTVIVGLGLIIAPSSSAQDMGESKLSFTQACIFWHLNGYKDSELTTSTGTIDMNQECESELGTIGDLTDPEFKQKCVDACVVKRGGTDESAN